MVPTFVLIGGRNQFAESFQQPCGVGKASRGIGLEVGQGVRRGDTGGTQRLVAELVAAAYRDDRHIGGAGSCRDARGSLAVQGLFVHGAFAGHHEVGPRESVVEADQIEDEVDAGSKLGAQHSERGEADPSRRPGARVLA
jgi:hypothetical protein